MALPKKAGFGNQSFLDGDIPLHDDRRVEDRDVQRASRSARIAAVESSGCGFLANSSSRRRFVRFLAARSARALAPKSFEASEARYALRETPRARASRSIFASSRSSRDTRILAMEGRISG